MKTQKRIWKSAVCLLLSLVTLLSVSCKKDPEGDGGATLPPSNNSGTILDAVPIKAFDRDFHVVSPHYSDHWTDEELVKGDQIAEAQFTRTKAFEELYQATVISDVFETEAFINAVSNARSAGIAYDLVLPHPTEGMGRLLTEGCYTNLNEVQALNLNSVAYSQSQVSNYNINNKLYLVASDVTIAGQGFYALVYNRQLMANYEFESDVKTLVDTKKWTMEAFNEMLKVAETAAAEGGDQFYVLTFNTNTTARFMYAMGESILVRQPDGSMSAGIERYRINGIAGKIYEMVYGHGEAVLQDKIVDKDIPDSKMYQAFKSSNSLFAAWDVGAQFGYLRNLEFKVGYAPLPLYDESQKEYRIFCGAGFIAIPTVCKDKEESGLFLEYISAHAYVHLRPTFYEVILQGRLSDNEDDYQMLELLHQSKVYDYGFTLDAKKEFINLLYTPVIINKAPDSVYRNIKGELGAKLEELVTLANTLGQ